MSSPSTPVNDADASRLATIFRTDLDALLDGRPISATALKAPRRRSAITSPLAEAVAARLFPAAASPLHALIQYERIIVDLRAAYSRQEKEEMARTTLENRANTWAGRIEAQGPWDEVNDPLSLDGPEAVPMPVAISSAESLAPFFEYLAKGGDFEKRGDILVQLEPFYDEPYIEFEKGVLYRDQRMDLCKMVVGPQHITTLLNALRTNSFVKHFLLGNNLIGPRGAQALAAFLRDYPDKIETWYLAGCCLDAPAFGVFVSATAGAAAIFAALAGHPALEYLDVAHAYTTPDLGVRYNYIADGAAPAIGDFVTRCRTLRALCLGVTALSAGALEALRPPIRVSGLCYYTGTSIHGPRQGGKADGVRAALEANIRALYGGEVTYAQFVEGPLRFLNSGEYVRYIDSVYRNRDAGKAKRGEMVLEKQWKEGDGTLEMVWGDR
ncbi:hypothetical protein FIBSPDRAFT_959345 [Athelia psychrophila]|uniref:Uncharacterized protein n=1 Tax=Athelia psychrophila TaxID=1759441 RepID=A0A166DNI1_9AGAM|nr:hypothetical protein FIBSPDRAFT_959345 [Fibularhizoctonia sp. CBS 109695]